MKQNQFLLSALFAVTLTCVLLVCVVIRAFFPLVILPQWNIPNLVLLCLPALLVEYFTTGSRKRCYPAIFLLAGITCGLLPLAAGFIAPAQLWMYALSGGVVFTFATWLFTSMTDRISSGPAGKLAPILSGFGLYLACQCFQGILL